MKMSSAIDLGRSLRQVFGGNPDSERQVATDRDRQEATVEAILERFFAVGEGRRELVLLADEVGMGKTYVALAVAVTVLDLIRQRMAPDSVPANQPVALVLTPNNEALYNKWLGEAEAFQRDCARGDGCLDWLQIERPLENSSRSGNLIDMTAMVRRASRNRPVLLIAKVTALGARLNSRDWWGRRAVASVFDACRVRPDDRAWWCRQVLGSGSQSFVPELLDLRKSNHLWADATDYSPDLRRAYERVLERSPLREQIDRAIADRNGPRLADLADDLTREALAADWPALPLVVIDEVHGLKNRHTQARRNVERYLGGRACRVLGLSATPFQLRHDELLSVLELRSLAQISGARSVWLGEAVTRLEGAMKAARDAGELFRHRWLALRKRNEDRDQVHAGWAGLSRLPEAERAEEVGRVRPPRIAHALAAALALEGHNRRLEVELRPFVIRHRHPRGYREHFVGRVALPGAGRGDPHFAWAPGMEVRGDEELTHYLMMRAVALAKEEKGLPGLGAELTGSYRHLIETSAVWRRLAQAKNPLLRGYRALLEGMLHLPEADAEHRKVQATVLRALDFFRSGQKTLIFCVYTKTAEAIRDELEAAIHKHLGDVRDRVFGGESAFENFRKRFFNRREPLYSLIQDHPLLVRGVGGEVGIDARVRLGAEELREVARLLVEGGELPDAEKPDRRLILAAVEHVAVLYWRERPEGRDWLRRALEGCPELEGRMASLAWLDGREPLSRRPGGARPAADPEAARVAAPDAPDEVDEWEVTGRQIEAGSEEAAINGWVSRLATDAVGDAVAPYFRDDVVHRNQRQLPLLAAYHSDLMAQFDLATREVTGAVFRRILMAEEFLLRYLADVPREEAERWADYLADRYAKPLSGHLESLRDRVTAYLETLARARQKRSLLASYHAAAENRNVVQLVQGGTANRDHYFLGFNTPYRPEILIATSVGQEGIDLHRECRHVIHHDLCWNPATIEQRTGRVDRIGSKVERERVGAGGDRGPMLEVAVPYLAATYDERMFEELYRRAQLFEVTMGGDVRIEGRVEGRIEADDGDGERRRREREGIGTEDEDLGEEGETGTVELPADMVERLRVNLSVWGE